MKREKVSEVFKVRLKNYKMSLDFGGLILFLFIMIPNLIWFVIPAPNDILRNDSITPELDIIASVSQMLFVVALCIFKNRNSPKRMNKRYVFVIYASCGFYFIAWCLYYIGIVNGSVMLSLSLFPCLAFLCYVIVRKNWIALIPTIIFTICHLIYGIANFVIG